MASLQPFLISEFKTGINTYLEPWIRPAEAFEPLINAYIYRGTINKRSGYTQYGNQLTPNNPVMGIMQFIDEVTGIISLVVASTTNLYLYNAGTNTFDLVLPDPLFSGNINQFFNWTNWQANDGVQSLLYMTNNNDNDGIVTFDGTASNALLPVIDGAGTTVDTCLDIQVYKQRLLLIKPTLSAGGVQNQSIYWSAIQNADASPGSLAWRTDIAGQGGFLAAPTGDIIQATEFIRDVLVVFFTNSTWIFRFTGNASDPFRWDKVNNTKSTNSPFGSLAYDERCTSIGNTGLIACDGVNVQRYDVPIIDYYETSFSEQYFAQSFSQRYDNLNQSWTLYVSNDRDQTDFPLVGSLAPGSDSALVYNFLENTWATYKWNRPLTCMGLYFNQSGKTWADMTQEWQVTDRSWNSFTSQESAPILLAGDTTGNIWYMDNEDAVVDEQINTDAEIIAVGTGVVTYSGTLANIPVVAGSVTITDGTETFSSNGAGTLTGDLGGTGSVTYDSGVFEVTFNTAVPALTNITANYSSGISIEPDIITTRWNPIMAAGQKVQFAYIDIYYYRSSLDPENPISVTLKFYVDNSEIAAASRTLTLDGASQSQNSFKRIFINLIGEFVQMEIKANDDTSVDSYMQFLGFILWAKPSGRLTP